MKMKQILALILALTLIFAAGCAGTARNDASMNTSSSASNTGSSSNGSYDSKLEFSDEADMEIDVSDDYDAGDGGIVESPTVNYAEKIIYTAHAEVQTLHFEEAVEQISLLVERLGGFVQSSSVTGQDYYSAAKNRQSYRTAHYTLRIPTEHFSTAKSALSDIGNVTYINTDTQNVTTPYYDTLSRLNTYRTEEERLFTMLDKCETVEEMLAIESHLSEVRYQIESLTTTLNHYDQRIAYSTLNLSLTEVAELTEEKPVVRSYWQQIADGFAESLQDIGRFFKNLFKSFLVAIPYLVILAVVAVIVVPFGLRILRKRRAKRAARLENKQDDTE